MADPCKSTSPTNRRLDSDGDGALTGESPTQAAGQRLQALHCWVAARVRTVGRETLAEAINQVCKQAEDAATGHDEEQR